MDMQIERHPNGQATLVIHDSGFEYRAPLVKVGAVEETDDVVTTSE